MMAMSNGDEDGPTIFVAPKVELSNVRASVMCGIVGFLSSYRACRPHYWADTVQAMIAPLRHRGPDDAGYWTDPAAGVALAQQGLGLHRDRARVVGIHVDRDTHFGENLVVARERHQRRAEHQPALDLAWVGEETQATDPNRLLVLRSGDQISSALDEFGRQNS